MLEKIISIVFILALTIFGNYLLTNLLKKSANRKTNKSIKTALIFTNRLKTIIIYSLGIVLCLSKFAMFKSLSVTLLSGLGISATILGLAAQQTLTNFVASIEILTSHPFEVGDTIRIVEKDVIGVVEEISMRHTVIRNYNNERIIIPNSSLNSLTVENNNFEDNLVCLFGEYSISYESDIDKAIEILKDELKKLNMPKEKEIKVRVLKWDSSAIILKAWVWGSDTNNAYENLWQLNYSLKKAYDKENITIPYEHINVIMEESDDK